MSVNHAAHMPQSLPSFAQAFSTSSLNNISSNDSNALPPIQSHSYEQTPTLTPPQARRLLAMQARQSPKAVKIKEEEDRDVLQVTAPSPPQSLEMSQDPSSALGAQHPSKKRRVTVSGTPHPPNATARTHVDPAASTPLSPTDDHSAREEARAILAPRHQPTVPTEQRGESVTGVALSAGQNPSVSGSVSKSPPEDHLSASRLANLPRIGRRSPNTISGVSRTAGNTSASAAQAMGRLSPPPMLVPSQQPPALISSHIVGESPKVQQSTIAHSLPPPPISFARRRAAQSGGRKKKPADILISPRGTGPSDPLAPVIQSAPPVADPGRFPMAIPRLPVDLNSNQTTRRVAGNVPPTPTRFILQHTTAPSVSSTVRASGHSPPTASVPIASSLVPATPSALQHPGYAGDKSAFLAPFGVFYDALNDSKQLKNWLADQLQKSTALMQSLKQQQERMDEIVEDLVEKRTRVMREEISMLRQRMESLEEVLLGARGDVAGIRPSAGGFGYPQGTKFPQNSVLPGPDPSSTYRFPASEQRRTEVVRRITSPSGMQEKELQQSPPPPVEAARRLSVSAGRSDSLRM
ncbi:hypothetical protein F5I97DRAFT_1788554, partial [Phlebopus sp. FC_14]